MAHRGRAAFGRIVPPVLALGAAAALIAGILAAGPRLHHTATAARPTPSATATPAPATLSPSLAPTAAPITPPTDASSAAPTPPPVVAPTPQPTPTPVPWSPPPQTVTEPQLVYIYTGQSGTTNTTTLHLVEMDWAGNVHGSLDVPGPQCQCAGYPMQSPPPYLPSPDGSRVILSGQRIVAADGSAAGALAPGAKSVWWDGDNRHLCRLDGPSSSQLSWVAPGASRSVTTLPVAQDDFWWVMACSSMRNRAVVARMHNPPNDSMSIVDLRSIEISSGRVIHDTPINGYAYPTASGDGTVVALVGNSTSYYNPDTGALLHSATGYAERLSWNGSRALVGSSPGSGQSGTTYQVVDWRHDTVLWSVTTGSFQWWSHELSDDLALAYQQTPSPAPSPGSPQQWDVTVVKPDGTASTHTFTS
jgi:hypothetical protein